MRSHPLLLGLLLILAAGMHGSCGSGEYGATVAGDVAGPTARQAVNFGQFAEEAAVSEPAPAPSDGAPGVGLGTMQASTPDRYLIKNGSVTLECVDPDEAAAQITEVAAKVNGYVAALAQTQNNVGAKQVSMTVRVPQTAFDETLAGLDALGTVLSREVRTSDVTEEYVDTDARVRNMKRTEERLLDHLSRVGELEDIVRIENELARIRGQIEQAEGRLRFLDHSVAYSTIQITLRQMAQALSPRPAESFSVGQVFADALRALWALARVLIELAVWLIVWSVIWVPVLLAVLYLKRRSQIAAAPVQASEPDARPEPDPETASKPKRRTKRS